MRSSPTPRPQPLSPQHTSSDGQRLAKRLADMGFVRGALVEMIRTGKPCLVRIGSTCVGLGADHQRSIGVQRT